MSATSAPLVSAVLCTRNRPEALDSCLSRLRGQTYANVEIVVVDSCSTLPGTREAAGRWGARYVRVDVAGLAVARNRGTRAARGDIVAFIDDDAHAEPDWIATLAVEFADPRVACATGHSVPPLGTTERDERICMLTQGPRSVSQERRIVDRTNADWFEVTALGGLGTGTNMAFRRSALLAVGFDEGLGRGTHVGSGEEHYAFFRLAEAAHRIVHQPKAVVIHPVGNTSRQLWRRFLLDRSGATAYMTKLFVEQPDYRARLLKYVAEGFAAKRRTFRPPGMTAGLLRYHPLVTLAHLSGPLRYLRGRLARRRPVVDACEPSTSAPGAAPAPAPVPARDS